MPTDLRELLKVERNLRRTFDSVRQFLSSGSENVCGELISVRLELLNDAFQQFKSVRTKIELITDHLSDATGENDDEEKLALDQAREDENVGILVEFEEDYCVLKTGLLRLQAVTRGSANINQSASSVPEPSGSSSTLARVKLPEIRLPSFSGQTKEWVSFRDSFRSLIHSSNQLTSMDKFSYLRSAVTGEALQEIASVELAAANYEVAWSMLEKRYENRKLIVKTYLDSLFSVEPMKKESYDSLNCLISEFERNLQMLEKVGEKPAQWSTLLVHMVCSRLDHSTLRQWETHHSSKEVPLFDDLMLFLRSHCSVLESISHRQTGVPETEKKRVKFGVSHSTIQSSGKCPFCDEGFHPVFRCVRFLKQAVDERGEAVKRARLCFNCLSAGHMARACSRGSCHHCGMRHHSLLHLDPKSSVSQPPKRQKPHPQPPVSQSQSQSQSPSQVRPKPNQSNPNQPPNTQPSTSYPVTHSHTSSNHTTDPQNTIALPTRVPSNTRQVLLSTALVRIQDPHGNTRIARALLDSCSQFCFMTSQFSQQLKLRSSAEHLTVQGIGGSKAVSRKLVVASVAPRVAHISSYSVPMNFFVLPELTATLPASRVTLQRWSLPQDLHLADPTFFEPGEIDLIIGAEYFFDLLLDGRFKLSDDGPSLHNSVFGWIIAGTIPEKVAPHQSSAVACSVAEVQEQLTKFWELESCGSSSIQSVDESTCEALFSQTTSRDSEGRFIVSLPKRDHVIQQLGESRSVAMRRFLGVERRFQSNVELQSAYKIFMNEYIQLGHMREVPDPDDTLPVYYLPHHAVMKPDSSTTKLRVVFDASCKTTTGVSLNDGLLVGPVVQEDLLSIVLRFRSHRIAIVADVEKMYRMVQVQPEDQRLQRILWRESPDVPIRTYELLTVTYGTACAPYLATKCLQKLAESGKESHPEAAKCLEYDTYVDDSLTGANSVGDAKKLATEMIELAAAGGFTLRKFNSNSSEVLSALPSHLIDSRTSLDLDSSTEGVKTLGLVWKPSSDSFIYECPAWSTQSQISKRVVLAETARLFDPLGLVGPVVVIAKMFLQDLWKLQCGWDDSLPEEMQLFWHEYRRNLGALSTLSVPRWLGFHPEIAFIEIHGFCDASEKAYGACVYLRCTTHAGEVTVRLITAKSRVAPLDDLKRKKKKQTIPRLELSSALVLAHLYEKVKLSLRFPHSAHFWTDSTIVICWLSSLPSRWQAFVANRVSEIQHITRGSRWRHVAGEENPADIISRGMIPAQLHYQSTWFEGPIWLRQDRNTWPVSSNPNEIDQSLLEERKVCSFPVTPVQSEIFGWRRSFLDLVHIVAWILRFAHNCRDPQNRSSGMLTFGEQNAAIFHIIRLAQLESFPEEVEALQKGRPLKASSVILSLNPVIDDGIIRVGGRLEHAPISEDRKHPMILCNKHPLAKMVVQHYHHRFFHAGAQLLVSSVRGRFWITKIKSLVNTVLHECVHCFRTKPRVAEQLMGDLPAERVSPSDPFENVGVDYCGPFLVKYPPNRRTQPRKHYVAIFVCLATKAVHIELVVDLTSDAFIAALKRFAGRRGKPRMVFCDNSSTFVGARRGLDELYHFFRNEQIQRAVAHAAIDEGIEFSFIPPRTPNFGGLWEAAVKSFKTHLKRTIGCTILQYDEMHTISVQIEAILNSRPLTPITNDPNDFRALTPGHFLIKRPLTAIPEPSKEHIPENHLSRWQRSEVFYERIWKRWSSQYLSDLHNRTKWTRKRDNIAVGTMVLLKEDNYPPLQWALGRVTKIYPGPDGNIRVVDVKTKDSEFQRGIQKICVLPIKDNIEDPSP